MVVSNNFCFYTLGKLSIFWWAYFSLGWLNHPWRFQLSPFALVARNCSAREIGLYEKQSSFFVQVPEWWWMANGPTGWVKDSKSCLGHSFNSNRRLWMVARSYAIETSRNTTITTIRTIYHSNRQKQGMSLNGKNCSPALTGSSKTSWAQMSL